MTVIDPQYPLFVLGGVIVDKKYAETELEKEVRDFKLRMFGTDQIILHTSDITRNRNGFEKLINATFRIKFQKELNDLMRSLEYKVVACAIRKDHHLSQYGMAAIDPYMLSLDILVERFCFEIGNVPAGGLIVAEKRDPTLDHELEIAWLNLKIKGTRYIQALDVEKRISSLNIRAKSENIAGLQLADLVVSPIGRHVFGKSTREDFEIVQKKFRKNKKGVYVGFGLVILPKEKGE